MANTSWTTTSGSISLSGSNLVATGTGQGSTLAGAYVSSGKFYVEITFDTKVSSNTAAGIAPDGTAFETVFTSSAFQNSIIVNGSGNLRRGGGSTTLASLGAVSLLCLAVDMDNGRLWARSGAGGNWNNSASADPATGIGGFSIPYQYVTLFCQTGTNNDKLTLNSGDTSFTGTVPSGFTSGWPTASDPQVAIVSQTETDSWSQSDAAYSPASVSAAMVDGWGQSNSSYTQIEVTGELVSSWMTASVMPTQCIVTAELVEHWGRQAAAQAHPKVSATIVEVWSSVGSGRPVVPPGTIYCGVVPNDATGDIGSTGVGMTDQLGGGFEADNMPIDATGDITTDPTPIVFQFSTETLSCPTAPLNATGNDAGSTGTGITSILADTITPNAQPIDATGDVVTTNEGVSNQITAVINCITTPQNATGDVGNDGDGITDQLDDTLTCNKTPVDADGGSGVPPSSYKTQIQ